MGKLELYELPRPLDEMNLKEAKQALKQFQKNVQILQKEIERVSAQIKADEISNEVSK